MYMIATTSNPNWIEEFQLRKPDREILEKGHWLTDRIIFEECACQLTEQVGFINMYIANIQQQGGGSACGLYAIAYTTALCFGRDPMLLKIKPEYLGLVVVLFPYEVYKKITEDKGS